MQGPWCPALLDYLQSHHQSYDVLIFFTYLYAPTVLGLQIDPAKSILVPTAHDEPAIRLGIYSEMFRLPAAVAYNTEVERHFLKSTFDDARREPRRPSAAAWTCCRRSMAPRATTASGRARSAGTSTPLVDEDIASVERSRTKTARR